MPLQEITAANSSSHEPQNSSYNLIIISLSDTKELEDLDNG